MTIDLKGTRDEFAALSKSMTALIERGNNRSGDERGMTADEKTEFDTMAERRDRLRDTITAAEKIGRDADPAEGRQTGHDHAGQTTDADGDGSVEVRMYNPETRETENVVIEPDDPRFQTATRAYRDSFRSYIRDGITEDRNLVLGSGENGGFLAPVQTSARLFRKADDTNFMSGWCDNVFVAEAGSLGVVTIETDPSDAEWTAEVSDTDTSDDTTMKTGRRELSPSPLTKRIDVSRTLLNRVGSAEGLVMDRLGYKIGRAQEAAYIEGSGAAQPLGVFTASDSGISTSRDVALGSTSNFTTDGLISMQHTLKKGYRRNAKWLMSRAGVKRIRKLKDGENVYIWRPGLSQAEPDTLLGSPLGEAELAPGHDEATDFASGKYVAVYGDFSYYMIATALNVTFLRDVYTSAGKRKVRFFAFHESDGMPILEEAFVRGKLST